MAYRGLRGYIETLDRYGLLSKIEVEVSNELEISEITDRVSKSGGPALLFNKVRGYNMPVVTNLFGSYQRMALALEVDNLDAVGQRITELTQFPEFNSLIDKVNMLPRLAQLSSFFPRIVKKGACKEVIIRENPDLSILPVLKCWPNDGGPFITLPLVFSKDPESGRRNVGMYRMQIFDNKTTGMHWHIHKDGAEHFEKAALQGERLEVAVAIGCDPAITYSATAPLPQGIDEMIFAGFLRKKPVELIKCETVNLEVPASSEIILEGYVNPRETRLEGPFGDHTGFYSLADVYPVFHLTCITHRQNPIYAATVVGRPPMEDAFLGKVTERAFLPLMKMQLPEIVDITFPPEGVFHNCLVVSIKKRYPGHARKVMNALWGMGQAMFTKLIIVVDDDVKLQNTSEVMWKIFSNIDAKRDLIIMEGPLDVLDHSSPLPCYGGKLGIDATRKWSTEGFNRIWPDEIKMSQDIKQLVDRKWDTYGIG